MFEPGKFIQEEQQRRRAAAQAMHPIAQEIIPMIQTELGVSNANFLSDIILSRVGASVFAVDEVSYTSRTVEEQIRQGIAQVPDSAFASWGTTRPEYQRRVLQLLGKGDITSGELGRALKDAHTRLEPEQYMALQRTLARLYAHDVFAHPGLIYDPSVRIDFHAKKLVVANIVHIPLRGLPRTVMEYGPGLVSMRKSMEFQNTPQTILMEPNIFTAEALRTHAALAGVADSSLTFIEEGMAQGTARLLEQTDPQEGMADIILASGVHAPRAEYEKAIHHSAQLLRAPDPARDVLGGLMLLRGLSRRERGGASVEDMMAIAQDTLGKPTFEETIYTAPAAGVKPMKGKVAVFQRNE